MAFPTIIFNASTGSDTAASGAGPAAAVTGTAAAHTGGVASTTITLTNSPDLSGVATDGSAALWMKTASGVRQFSKITGADNTAKTVTVEDSFTIEEASAVDYAIGGKRATWDNADSRSLLADVKPSWTIETETDQTITSALTGKVAGSTAAGVITWRGASETIRTITQSADTPHFNSYATNIPTWWNFEYLKFQNSNATKTSAYGIYADAGIWNLSRCIFGDATNKLYRGVSRASNAHQCNIVDCEVKYCDFGLVPSGSSILRATGLYVHDCTYNGILSENGQVILSNSIIENNGSDGIKEAGTPTVYILENCTIHGNGGDGIELVNPASQLLRIQNCNITKNNGYGIKAHANQRLTKPFVDYNNFGTGTTANSSGNVLNIDAGPHDLNVDPQYTDADAGDFSVGTNVQAKGFPDATRYIGANQSLTRSYVDIGAAQRQEAAGGGGGGNRIFGSGIITPLEMAG